MEFEGIEKQKERGVSPGGGLHSGPKFGRVMERRIQEFLIPWAPPQSLLMLTHVVNKHGTNLLKKIIPFSPIQSPITNGPLYSKIMLNTPIFFNLISLIYSSMT